MSFLRFLLFLALAAWLGALIFFPMVASIAFSVLPSAHLAGMVVRNSLRAVHWIGLIGGPVLLVSSLVYDRAVKGRFQPFRASHGAVVIMLLLTGISEFQIIPRMDSLRVSAGEIASLPLGSPIRREFDRLHARSVEVESAILVLAVLVLYLTSRRFDALPS